jgi:protocatechuate 3,4-dioxygenase beta subunit
MKLLTRRALLRSSLGAGLLAACSGSARRPTPAIADGGDDHDDHDHDLAPECTGPTADNIEGPFYKPGAPWQATLADAKEPGERLALAGFVTSTDCTPLSDVVLDIWHADARGGYDNDGFHLRGKLRTDADGRWAVSTIIPGRYLNGPRYRPAHIHVKLRAAGHRALTTQLYFDGDPYNDGDPFIVDSLIMKLADGSARFDFVLEPA